MDIAPVQQTARKGFGSSPADLLRFRIQVAEKFSESSQNHSERGKPATRRLRVVKIFQAAGEKAQDELRWANQKLAFSGIAGGMSFFEPAAFVISSAARLPLAIAP
jgi:hypothetical protein